MKNETLQELLLIVNEVLRNRQKRQLSELNVNKKLREDIGFDSLDLAELTVRIEFKFNVDVFEDGLVDTIGEIMNKLGLV
jgi:acyl carrier protein